MLNLESESQFKNRQKYLPIHKRSIDYYGAAGMRSFTNNLNIHTPQG